ncbi:MAG: tetratricopeptide repeat protein [Campylobacterota bacterium]|nr:tetratricopeptide repeat protein [Campylobacterota bacterium]
MDGLFLEYRDPLFGIIVLFVFIFTVSFLTYTYGTYKEKKARKEYRKLLKRFELGNLKDEDYVHLYTTYNLPFDSILLLASTFLYKGKYNKAISVYLSLLEHVDDRVKKEELLELLGSTYFKGGFLQRSKEIFLKILKFSPRNKKALHHLQLINEKLKSFDDVEEVIAVLQELGENVQSQKIYVTTLKTLNDPILSFEKKSNLLLQFQKQNKMIEKLVIQFLLKYNKSYFWENLDQFTLKNCEDLLWEQPQDSVDINKIQNHPFLSEIYTAKGYVNCAKQSDKFEFNLLITVADRQEQAKVDLNFEYICSSCKSLHPIYESRCPHCQSILTFNTKPYLTKRHTYEENFSLQ